MGTPTQSGLFSVKFTCGASLANNITITRRYMEIKIAPENKSLPVVLIHTQKGLLS
jgi:hypothetical protein